MRRAFYFHGAAIAGILTGLLNVCCRGDAEAEGEEGTEVVSDAASRLVVQREAARSIETDPPDAAAVAQSIAGAEQGTLFTVVCAQCHGPDGRGKIELQTPSIAGLPEWYVKAQIEKFRTGLRGSDSRDPVGAQMHAIARTLQPEQVEEVADEIAALESTPHPVTVDGDPDRGRILYAEQCMECHRYNGSGELVFLSAPLTGFQDWYILNQLTKFKAGLRGVDEKDEKGAKMHALSQYLSEQDMKDLAAYIVKLGEYYGGGNRSHQSRR